MTNRRRIAWAVSGQGRALQAVLQAIDAGLLPVEIALVLTDRASPIEGFAQARKLPVRRIEPWDKERPSELIALLSAHEAEWMGLTFNRLLPEAAIAHMGGRIFNLHMSLLPMFPGFGALRRTIEVGMRMAGVTVHLIDARTDAGRILGQSVCPVSGADTRDTLGARMFGIALPLLLQVVRSIGTGELTFNQDNAQKDPERNPILEWPRADVLPASPAHTFPAIDDDLTLFADAFCRSLLNRQLQSRPEDGIRAFGDTLSAMASSSTGAADP